MSCRRVSFASGKFVVLAAWRGVNPSLAATRVFHSASIRTARFMVALLKPASFQRLSLVSLPSVRYRCPASSRSMASR
jgi:hypothetical protein